MTWETFTTVDPVIWMRMARVLLYFIAGLLMLREPMLCGGKNTPLHRMLAALFFVNAWYSYSIARLRMASVVLGHPVPILDWNMVSEVIMTGLGVALVSKLGYDYVRWSQYQKMECIKRACDENTCVPRIQIDYSGQERRREPCPLKKEGV